MGQTNRRKFLGGGVAAAAAATAASTSTAAAQEKPVKRVITRNARKADAPPPLFNSTVAYGNLLFIAGVGYHEAGDITVHTEHVLESIRQQLEAAGSSMEKCLKCNVYLNDLKDYDGMNKVFRGKFGAEPPVRTTIAAAGGIPGNSLVEIDVIAYL
jgi:enamine deaminase RidA (YjgF/YER057c/UK114 family)